MSSTILVKSLYALALGTLASCQYFSEPQIIAVSTPDIRLQTLSNMNEDFYLNAAMAGVIGDKCPSLGFDKSLYTKLDRAHIKKYGTRKVYEERKAVNKEIGGYLKRFEQRHSVSIKKNDLCIAGMREIAEKTPLSLLLTTSA